MSLFELSFSSVGYQLANGVLSQLYIRRIVFLDTYAEPSTLVLKISSR